LEILEKRLKANIIKVNQNRGIPGIEAEVEKLDIAINQVSLLVWRWDVMPGCKLIIIYRTRRLWLWKRKGVLI
jgi:hypothetical protein